MRGPDGKFEIMNPTKVRVVKPNGDTFEDVDAGVQSKVIFFNDPTLPLEVGDMVQRKLPSGLIEQFEITEPNFYEDSGPFPAHFQAKVKRYQGATKTETTHQVTATYNLHGANSRVNIASTDNSVTIGTTEQSVFDDLRTFITNELPEINRQAIVAAVNEMEAARQTGSFRDKYLQFVGVAADHLGLLTPFLPVLASLLAKN